MVAETKDATKVDDLAEKMVVDSVVKKAAHSADAKAVQMAGAMVDK